MAHCVESAEERWPFSTWCIEDAQAALTAGHGSETASLIAKITWSRACFENVGSGITYIFDN